MNATNHRYRNASPLLRATRRHPLSAVIAGALACFAAQASSAQEAATPAEPEVIDAIVVTANKRVENIRKVGSSISVLGEQQLENISATQLTDYAGYVPGLEVTSGGSPGQATVTMRGIAPLSSGSTVGFYLDETPIGSSGLYQEATEFALDLLPYDIQRIEILRGPQGTLYGAGAMGGLLKYVSREPDASASEFRVGGGFSGVSGGEHGNAMRFGANVPLVEDSLALRVSFARNNLPGYIDNTAPGGSDDINGGSQTSARVALKWEGERTQVTLSAMKQSIDSDNNGAVALDPATFAPIGGDLTRSVIVDEPFSKDVTVFSGTVSRDLGWADFISSTGYSEVDTLQFTDASVQYGNFADLMLGYPDPGSSFISDGFGFEKFSQEFRLSSKSGGKLEWMLGAFYTKEDAAWAQRLFLRELDGTKLQAPFDAYDLLADISIPSEYRETAVFANASYRFNERFRLDAGFRYASNDQTFTQSVVGGVLLPIEDSPGASDENVFTWSISPKYEFSDDVMLYGKVATGYQPGGPNVVVPGLPRTVASSTLISYELGLKSQFADDRVQLDVVAFRVNWEDIQVVSVVNGIGGLVNGGKASSQGLEFSSAFKATERLQLGLNVSYTDAVLSEDFPTIVIPSGPYVVEINTGLAGDAMPYVPEWSWSATVDYGFPLDGAWNASIGGGFRWVDGRVAGTTKRQLVLQGSTVVDSELTLPLGLDGYHSLDLYASASNERWTVRAYVKNATDERTYTRMSSISNLVTGAEDNVRATPILPRTVGIEFDYRF